MYGVFRGSRISGSPHGGADQISTFVEGQVFVTLPTLVGL